ncbi:MAG: fliY [Clostridiaceae bacterium]|nr:fliY [Clostridiaceae bacterium]
MSNGFLSQEEIDSLLNGGPTTNAAPAEDVKTSQNTNVGQDSGLSDVEKDLLGEIGNISMGSASTALSTIINQQVNITTPVVSVTTLSNLKGTFEVPNISLEVKYTSGIIGENLLVMKVSDAAVISNLMMGGNGVVDHEVKELSEIEESAVSEAMNQMIGSAATSMATMFVREVNISPPKSKIWNDYTSPLADGISDDEPIVRVSFKLTIGELVDSEMMQLLPINTAKKIVGIMMGEETQEKPAETPAPQPKASVSYTEPPAPVAAPSSNNAKPVYAESPSPVQSKPIEVQRASFESLGDSSRSNTAMPHNIDLILDVPLEVSVLLGRAKKNVKDILNMGTGSLIELDKLAEEPVEILVNGKKVAYGEVVVIDENFGVRITSIVSGEERIKNLGR